MHATHLGVLCCAVLWCRELEAEVAKLIDSPAHLTLTAPVCALMEGGPTWGQLIDALKVLPWSLNLCLSSQ